jgi:hypothetical protein
MPLNGEVELKLAVKLTLPPLGAPDWDPKLPLITTPPGILFIDPLTPVIASNTAPLAFSMSNVAPLKVHIPLPFKGGLQAPAGESAPPTSFKRPVPPSRSMLRVTKPPDAVLVDIVPRTKVPVSTTEKLKLLANAAVGKARAKSVNRTIRLMLTSCKTLAHLNEAQTVRTLFACGWRSSAFFSAKYGPISFSSN